MRRVLIAHNKLITLSFLLVEHTNVSLDWYFCLIKEYFRYIEVNSVNKIANVVKQSSVDNIAHLAVSEDGQVLVPTYNSTSFLTLISNVPNIKYIPNIKISLIPSNLTSFS